MADKRRGKSKRREVIFSVCQRVFIGECVETYFIIHGCVIFIHINGNRQCN